MLHRSKILHTYCTVNDRVHCKSVFQSLSGSRIQDRGRELRDSFAAVEIERILHSIFDTGRRAGGLGEGANLKRLAQNPNCNQRNLF